MLFFQENKTIGTFGFAHQNEGKFGVGTSIMLILQETGELQNEKLLLNNFECTLKK